MESFAPLVRAMEQRDAARAARLIKTSLRSKTGGAPAAAKEQGAAPLRAMRARVEAASASLGGDEAELLLRHAEAVASGAAVDAYASECAALSAAMRAWKGPASGDGAANPSGANEGEEGGRLNPVLWALAGNVRALAAAADRELVRRGGAPSRLSDAANVLRGAFAETMKGGSPGRRRAALEFLKQLFCVYFRLNTLGQCKHLMRTVGQKNFPPFERFPAAHRVTYSYYAGRLCVFHDEFDQASRHLSYALRHCQRRHGENRRRILRYLSPVRMLAGSLPTRALLRAHEGLEAEFAGAAAAVRTGDLRAFDACLRENFFGFVKSGIYLLMEKMRTLVLRTLLRRVHACRGGHHQLRLEDFRAALAFLTEGEVTMDEAECAAANLVYRKYVRGYISHAKRVLVVSKQQPFPALCTVPVPVD